MLHYFEAKDLLSRNVGKVLSIFLLTFLIGFVSGVVGLLPLGIIVCVIGALFVEVLEILALRMNIVDGNEYSWSHMIKTSWTAIKDNAGPILMVTLFYFLEVIGLTFLTFILVSLTIMGSLFSPIFGILLFLVEYIFMVILLGYVSYSYTYSLSYILYGMSRDEANNAKYTYKKDMFGMSWRIALLSCIPIVGFVFVIIWGYRYAIKIQLDTYQKQEEIMDIEVEEVE